MNTPEIRLPEVEINLYRNKQPATIPVIESYICTSGASPNFIRHLTFDVSGTELEGKVKPGQSIGIIAPGLDERGKPHQLRLYSVSSPSKGEDGAGKHISTTVKRVIDEHEVTQQLFAGVCSNYICSLKPGDTVQMTGPAGKHYLIPENQADFNYVFFATGTGVAPFRGMVQDLIDKGSKSQIILVLGVPYRTDVLYEKHFRQMEKDHPNFHFIVAVSREEKNPDGTRNYVQSKIRTHAEILQPVLKSANSLIYICGMKGMESGIYQELNIAGIEGFTTIKEDMGGKPAAEWTPEDIKKYVRSTDRMFVEVY